MFFFKWHCQLNQVYSIVLFVVKDHVRLELRNNDVNWEGTSSGGISADVTKKRSLFVGSVKPFRAVSMCLRMELWCQVYLP